MVFQLKKRTHYFLKYPHIILGVLVLIFIVYFYSPILYHPTEYILNDKGDAIKNYFCYDWHVQNDSSAIYYTGSNYPFGELHSYTDGNPLLGNFIRLFPTLKPYSIGIFNLSMIFSIFFCALILLSIFKLFNMSNTLSILAALGITILSPQSFRLAGHLSLSYSFTIPLTILFLLKQEGGQNKSKYSILLSIFIISYFLIHPYLGMINASLIFLYWIIKLFFKFSFDDLKSLLTQVILPVLVYYVFIKLTDTKTDRPTNPYGFLYFTANIETVFISTLPPFRHFLSQLYKIRGQNWEGIAYVGVTSLIAIGYMIVTTLSKRKIITESINRNSINKSLFYLFVSSLILLLFSMGYPFKWNLEFLLDYLPFIKQFRAPGRFAWPFYFIMTILSSIIISKRFFTKSNIYLKTSLSGLLLMLFLADGIPYHNSMSKYIIKKNCFNKKLLDSETQTLLSKINKNSQAILPLPFFHIGSDFFNFEGTDKIKKEAFIIAYHSKIPLLANLTPRTSFNESVLSIQLFSNQFITKKMLSHLRFDKPLMVLFSKEFISQEEQMLFNKCEIIVETENFILASIMPTIFKSVDLIAQKKQFENKKNQMIHKDGLYIKEEKYVNFLDFDNLPGGVFKGTINSVSQLLEIPENTLENNKIYEINFWYYALKQDVMNNTLKIKSVLNNDSSVTIAERNINSMPNYINKITYASCVFKIEDSCKKHVIVLEGLRKDPPTKFHLDNLLVHEFESDVYFYVKNGSDSSLIMNNFILK